MSHVVVLAPFSTSGAGQVRAHVVQAHETLRRSVALSFPFLSEKHTCVVWTEQALAAMQVIEMRMRPWKVNGRPIL